MLDEARVQVYAKFAITLIVLLRLRKSSSSARNKLPTLHEQCFHGMCGGHTTPATHFEMMNVPPGWNPNLSHFLGWPHCGKALAYQTSFLFFSLCVRSLASLLLASIHCDGGVVNLFSMPLWFSCTLQGDALI